MSFLPSICFSPRLLFHVFPNYTVGFFPNFLPVKGVLVHPCTHLSLLPLSSRPSLFFLPSGDGNQLLGSLGNIVGALDDLLSEELVVHRGGPGLLRGSLTTLHLQPGGTGGQQAEGAVDRIQRWSLWTKEGGRKGGIGENSNMRQHDTGNGELTLGKSEAISVTAVWIFSEHGIKLENPVGRNQGVTGF